MITSGDTTTVAHWAWHQRKVLGLAAESGKVMWEFPIERHTRGQAVAGLLHDGDRLYLPNQAWFAAHRFGLSKQVMFDQVWLTDLRTKGPNTASPVLTKGLLFMVSDRGDATCLRAASGEVLWQTRLPRGRYYASPVAMGGHVYFPNTEGVTTVVAAAPTFLKLAENALPGGIYASPAPLDDQLLIRTTAALWCRLFDLNANAGDGQRDQQIGGGIS